MKQEDILRMMREAHLDVYGLGKDREKFVSVIERFAALVATAERKACAKVCDELADDAAKEQDFHALAAAESCAEGMRARGQE